MISIADIRRVAQQAVPCSDGERGVVVSADWLERVADELEAGRRAQEQVGQVFGLRGCLVP